MQSPSTNMGHHRRSEAVGDGANKFSPGAEVFGQLLIPPLGSTGTYAEHVAVIEEAPLARVPKGLNPSAAAALPTAGGAALRIISSLEPLEGKVVLLVGAAGGIGTFATQLAANAGARVIVVARASANNRMRAYGAAETIDHTAVSVPDTLERTHPDGIGTALHQLATDLARERRRVRELERELAELRSQRRDRRPA